MPHQDYVNDRKPLVSFASKPRPTAKQDGVKKPAFLVVRKKASLLQKKKMCEVKSFSSTQPQPISSSEKSKHGTESKKLLPNDAEELEITGKPMYKSITGIVAGFTRKACGEKVW